MADFCATIVRERVYSFNSKTPVSKTGVPGASPGGPANLLLLAFFMLGALHAPLAKLLQFNLAFHLLFVLLAQIIGALADRAGEFDKAVLGHEIAVSY